ncbi:MAG: NarL family signal transduction histidine kinase [Gemmatimonadetes bacterium]|nr:NarL family signal transduction histidine kinase [Gemmatimonadota bacterium]
MDHSVDELRAILVAYQQVAAASWPDLNPTMKSRAARWATASASELKSELDGYLREVASPRSNVRIMWKTGPKYQFGGCNAAFAQDAGVTPDELIGMDDFDKRLPWRHQAAKYRRDDETVVKSGKASLDIIERQESTDGGTSWVRAGKAPLKLANGTAFGMLAMYEIVDAATGRTLFMKSMKPDAAAKV